MSELLYGREPTTPAFVVLAASGLVIAAVAGKRIRVFSYYVNSLAATNVKFQSNATDISTTHFLGGNGGAVLPYVRKCWFRTAVGEALNLNMSAATSVGVQLEYDLDDSVA